LGGKYFQDYEANFIKLASISAAGLFLKHSILLLKMAAISLLHRFPMLPSWT
jgi:hypothetical protein